MIVLKLYFNSYNYYNTKDVIMFYKYVNLHKELLNYYKMKLYIA